MDAPWPRLKEYMSLVAAMKLHTAPTHADHAVLGVVLNKLRELYLFVKQVQERLEQRYRMLDIQRRVLDAPVRFYLFSYLCIYVMLNIIDAFQRVYWWSVATWWVKRKRRCSTHVRFSLSKTSLAFCSTMASCWPIELESTLLLPSRRN